MPVTRYKKEEILDACFEVFVRNGYSKTSTAMLSEAAGISKALLFHHFKNKKKIYINVLFRCFEQMAKEFEEELLSDFDNFFDAKGSSGLNKINYLRQNPDLGKIMYEAYVATPDELKEEIYEFTLKIKKKYESIELSKQNVLKDLFDAVPLREDIKSEDAYELIKVVENYFREQIAKDLTDANKLSDDGYWEALIAKKIKFFDMIRKGIEEKER